jgi:molybdopterin/thiamine biosynthesis adenylyltransferase
MAGALWGIGALMKVPSSVRFGMLALLWAAVVGLHVALPDGHPLRMATGGAPQGWVALGIIAGLALAYRAGLRRLRAKVAPAAAQAPSGAFRPAELDRYARHIMLREIGGPGQRKLKDSKILVIGAGGLGSPSLLYLAGAGVGILGFVDDDMVDGSNLQRQIIHADQRIGMPKVFSAEIALRALNPFIELRPYHRRLDEAAARALFADYDLILDGTDNFDTRYMVNRLAVELGKPLISGAITQWEGQLSLFDPARGGRAMNASFPPARRRGWCPHAPRRGWRPPCPA